MMFCLTGVYIQSKPLKGLSKYIVAVEHLDHFFSKYYKLISASLIRTPP